MKKMSNRGQRWLKGFHVFFSSCWVGAAVCLTTMMFFKKADDGMQLYGINISFNFIDDYIINLGLLACYNKTASQNTFPTCKALC